MRRRFALAVAVLAVVLAGAVPAAAAGSQHSAVSADPVDWTPHVLDGTVYSMAVVGDEVVVGGSFDQVRQAGRSAVLRRHNLFAFRLGTGAVSADFAPSVNGTVSGLAAGPTGTVYVGGDFTEVDGRARRGVAELAVATGEAAPGFDASVEDGAVTTLVTRGSALYLGGTFSSVGGANRPALARVSAGTGAVDAGFDARLSQPRVGRLRVQKLAVSGGRLAVAGTFAKAGGQDRDQLALVSADTGAVSGWSTDAYQEVCDESYNTYLRGLDFAPDGSYLMVATSGHHAGPTSMCDGVARFNTAGTGNHRPAWVNRTGGNSLLSVATTGGAVYVGGHEQWLSNPNGDKSAGPGAISRPGIGALDPATGAVLSWNPTRTRGVGVEALVTYPAGASYPGGLLVGSDTTQLGHEYHARVGAFPLP